MTLGRQTTLTLATRPHRWQQLIDLAMPSAETSHFPKAKYSVRLAFMTKANIRSEKPLGTAKF
jgi:hypothetical protein